MKLGEKFTKCKRCNRKLKSLEAQTRGYGKYCFQIHLEELNRKQKNLIDSAKEMNIK